MNGIVIAAYPPDSRWAIDIPSEACDLLQEVISKKKDRIRGLDKPKILIIINRYAFEGIIGNTTYFHDCMPVLSDLEAFHTVYMVAQEKENTDGVIHTLHPNWG